VALVLTFGEGELVASFTIDAGDTEDNATLADLLADINAVIGSLAFDVAVSNDGGTLVFASDTVDIEITPDSVSADLLGLVDVAGDVNHDGAGETSEFSSRPSCSS
jgi:hypothetical protein